MPHQHVKVMGSRLNTLLVYEEEDEYRQYAGAGKHPVCVYDRERAVIEAARRIGQSLGVDKMRVVFIVPVKVVIG
jgi:hypothetical protein